MFFDKRRCNCRTGAFEVKVISKRFCERRVVLSNFTFYAPKTYVQHYEITVSQRFTIDYLKHRSRSRRIPSFLIGLRTLHHYLPITIKLRTTFYRTNALFRSHIPYHLLGYVSKVFNSPNKPKTCIVYENKVFHAYNA